MRVIAGTARGTKLKELSGTDTRPTTDRVKESLFNIIQFDIEGRRVLDLFGGTGQLGIETLSRGAEHAIIVDAQRDATTLIRENLRTTQLMDKATVVHSDSIEFLKRSKNDNQAKFDVIFLDPPYNTPLLAQALDAIVAFDILREHGIIVCESSIEHEFMLLDAPYEKGKEYRYGKIKLTTYRREGKGFRL